MFPTQNNCKLFPSKPVNHFKNIADVDQSVIRLDQPHDHSITKGKIKTIHHHIQKSRHDLLTAGCRRNYSTTN